jgi:arylformamidase
MSRDYIDISRRVTNGIAAWPGSRGFASQTESSIANGDEANGSAIVMDVHVGTHVDSPLHFIENGKTIGEIGLDPFVGAAYVAEILDIDAIGRNELDAAAIPEDVDRLLLRTRNSLDEAYFDGAFIEDFAALSLDGAEWVRDRGLKLIGIDYMSVQRYTDSFDTHRLILGAGICILEGCDLRNVSSGSYDLLCLPLRLDDLEAAPARALLRSHS